MDKYLKELLDKPNKVTVNFEHKDTGQIVKITMEGNGICCRDIRNRIVWGLDGWMQLDLKREEI